MKKTIKTTTEQTTKPKEQPKEKKLPLTKFRSGALTATIWSNEQIKEDGEKFENFTFNIERNYKDKQDVWQSTTSFRKKDIVNVTALIHRVTDFLMIDEDEEKDRIE